MKQRFFKCERCGNIYAVVKDSGVPVMCCGQRMTEILPASVEASVEKHTPVFKIEGNKVYVVVGSVEHPMEDKHYIEWISLQTKSGNQRKCLTPGQMPVACFSICERDEVEAVYAYCNLHGLWIAENKTEPACPVSSEEEQPVVNSSTNYTVCKCNKVSYFDILDAVHNSSNIDSLLNTFDAVKDTTHCSTGCGGCYNKVIAIISDAMSGNI
ncbi:MAG: (2Fe-2S)-binding protein [Clostridia bacterium]|nr:(2Fe-2S)-binding protein [Clostridia bacterium]